MGSRGETCLSPGDVPPSRRALQSRRSPASLLEVVVSPPHLPPARPHCCEWLSSSLCSFVVACPSFCFLGPSLHTSGRCNGDQVRIEANAVITNYLTFFNVKCTLPGDRPKHYAQEPFVAAASKYSYRYFSMYSMTKVDIGSTSFK
ncbi:unnamed protein product [Soboliphyme baturini]|uniref:Uncharacterized protein n=1 Tax=Soboliphyme baturini TaxID=241478 RepID=A0A3P8AF54_9BILA|nr:unnamed protein product [Soboliphyme baturini]